MKIKKHELLTVVLFCGFLVITGVCFFLLPKKTFSETEKRFLSQTPELSWNSVSTGQWGAEAETYMADHIPGRDFFVGLNAYFDLYTGRQAAKDIWVWEDRLLEAPVSYNASAAERNLESVTAFASNVGVPVNFMLVPSAGWAAGLEDYRDDAYIRELYAMAQNDLDCIDVLPVFAGKPELYYRTDHHWTSAGAYAGYQAYQSAVGREYRPAESFEVTVAEGFRGSTYSRSALWLTPGEGIELWQGSDNLTVTNGEQEGIHQGVFYPQRLEEADKYTVFLDGNHSVVRISNPAGEGKLLVVRDSYSNCLGCFLAESYEEVILIDLRYYKTPVSELIRSEEIENVLVCYSIGNFLTDTNLFWLK